jgi:hypothetical protein
VKPHRVTRKDIVGLSTSIAIAIGALLLMPLPKSGWGSVCGWSTMFPIYGPLFPDVDQIVFDGCDGQGYGLVVAIYLSLVLMVVGAIASRMSQHPSRRRGAAVNAALAATTLVVLFWHAEGGFDAPRSLGVAAIAIAIAASIGFAVGPRRTTGSAESEEHRALF